MKRHVPFEFVGKVAGSSAMAEAGDIEGGTRSRHDDRGNDGLKGKSRRVKPGVGREDRQAGWLRGGRKKQRRRRKKAPGRHRRQERSVFVDQP